MKAEYAKEYGKKCPVDVGKVEKLFQVAITLVDRDSGRLLRAPTRGFRRHLFLGFDGALYTLSHEGKITSRSIHCPNCRSRHVSYRAYLRHRSKTSGSSACKPGGSQVRVVGGGFDVRAGRDLWLRLAAEGVTVPAALRFPAFFAVYDFETRFQDVHYPIGEKGTLDKRLHLVSFAVATNLPGLQNIHFDSDPDPTELFRRFWRHLLKLRDEASKLIRNRWRRQLQKLKTSLHRYKNLIPMDSNTKESTFTRLDVRRNCVRVKQLSSLIDTLERYIHCFPVLGFNAANFDLPLIKKDLAEILADDPNAIIIKAGQTLKSIQTQGIRFLDISQYLAPGYSLKKFLHAYLPELNPGELKGCFPYEWLTSWEKLVETKEFPPHSGFHSSLRGGNISDDEYAHALSVWRSLPAHNRTMLSYLEWYNKLDVEHLLRACEVVQAYWVERVGQQPFRHAVSLPGLALRMAYARKDFTANILLPNKTFKEAHEMIKRGFVGGPAIVFLRYSEVGKTRIKEWRYGSEAKPVGSVVTYDLNSLYLWAMSRCPMPCDSWTHYTTKDGLNFQTTSMYRYYKEELEWLAFRQAEDEASGVCGKHHIVHQWNGGPVKLGNIPVDGFCGGCRSVYMYDGARFHGTCPDCPPVADPERAAELQGAYGETQEKRAYLRQHFPNINLIQVCSCQWTRIKQQSLSVRQFCRGVFPERKRINPSIMDLLAAVKSGDFFGILEIDIQVPDELIEKYETFPPFFCNQEIKMEMLSRKMAEMGKEGRKCLGRRLVSTLEAERFVVISPLLQFYLQRGFTVTKVHQAVRMTPRLAFHRLGEEIFDLRCAATTDPSLQIQAETAKLIGNSAYGKTCERKEKHSRVRCVRGEKLDEVMQSKRFKGCELLGEDLAEVSENPALVFDDTPKVIGVFIVGYAKLQLLRFAYMLMDFCDEKDWSPVLCDTDSLCLELSVANGDLDAIIRPDKWEEWLKVRSQFLPSNLEVREQRRHGIFKVETLGDAVVALSAKSYAIRMPGGGVKTAAKGISKRLNDLSYQEYADVLNNSTEKSGVNRGFRRTPQGELYQYRQEKVALSSFYAKRLVADDNVNTRTIRFPRSVLSDDR